MHRKQHQPAKPATWRALQARGMAPAVRLQPADPGQEANERISGHLGTQEDRLRIVTPRASCAPLD